MDNIYDGFMSYIYDFCPYFGRDKSKMTKHYLSMLEIFRPGPFWSLELQLECCHFPF